MLGALSVAPLVPWLWLRGWHAASGAAVVFAILELNLAPVVAAPVAALIAFRMPDAPRWHSVKRGMLGAAGAVVAAVAVLGVRGELRSYLETFAYNVHYAGARTQSEGFLGRAHDHLRILTDSSTSLENGSYLPRFCSSSCSPPSEVSRLRADCTRSAPS